MSPAARIVTGVVLACIVAALALRARALAPTGALAAAVIGTIAVTAGWDWGVMLVAYFLASSLLSRYRQRDKDVRGGGRVAKGGPRDATQVVANGGVFAAAALAYTLLDNHAFLFAGAGALAASAADTWATEIGMLARQTPRSIVSLQPVPAGTSGGVTAAGLLASLAGAAFIALAAFAAGWGASAAIATLVGGFGGSLDDSALGATVQARRWCPQCSADTEREVHSCGTHTRVTGGWAWMDNDVVNVLATISGALLATILGLVLTR